MRGTVTNLDSYVDGEKVVCSDATTVTLESGIVLKKERCQFVFMDLGVGTTYYIYETEEKG